MEALGIILENVEGKIKNPKISSVEQEARKKITGMLRKFDKVAQQNDRLTAYEMYIIWKMVKESDDIMPDLINLAYKAGYVKGYGSRKKSRA